VPEKSKVKYVGSPRNVSSNYATLKGCTSDVDDIAVDALKLNFQVQR
jgi:hypothetical protein